MKFQLGTGSLVLRSSFCSTIYSKFYAHYNKMDELNNLFIIFQYNQYFRKNLKTLLKNINAKKKSTP